MAVTATIFMGPCGLWRRMGLETPRGPISNGSFMELCLYLESRPDAAKFAPVCEGGDEPDTPEVDALLVDLAQEDIPPRIREILTSLSYMRGAA